MKGRRFGVFRAFRADRIVAVLRSRFFLVVLMGSPKKSLVFLVVALC